MVRTPNTAMVATTLATAAAAALLVFPSCNEYQLSGTEHFEVFTQAPAMAVDILFVVDNSPSMEQEQQKVMQGFAAFIFEVMESNSDFHIGVITTDLETNEGGILLDPGIGGQRFIDPSSNDGDYAAPFMQLINGVGISGSGWEKGLQATKKALLPHPAGFADTENEGFVRPDAALAVIVVSDEDDCSDEGALPHQEQIECYDMEGLLVPVLDYLELLKGLKDGHDQEVTFSAIVGPPSVDSCEDTRAGHRYLTLATKLLGLKGDICAPDFDDIMRELGLTVTGIHTWFALEATPDLDTMEVMVDDVPVDEDPGEGDGWSYRADDNAIYFWGDAIPPRESTVTFHYWTHESPEND